MKLYLKVLTVNSLIFLSIQSAQAEKSTPYIDALSNEAEQTNIKPNKKAIITDIGPEPAIVPNPSDNIDILSKKVLKRLKQLLTSSSSKEEKQQTIAEIVSSSVKKGHKIDNIQNAVNDAMTALSKQGDLEVNPETIEVVEETINAIVTASKDIAQGNPNDPYIKSLIAEANETSTSTVITIVVLNGDSLSAIAGKVYGSFSKYKLLYEANKDILKDPDSIFIGQILKIPPLR